MIATLEQFLTMTPLERKAVKFIWIDSKHERGRTDRQLYIEENMITEERYNMEQGYGA